MAGDRTLDWNPCEDQPTVQCASLSVPLDRADPDSRTVALAVRRLPATDPTSRLGVLVTIPGGPGQRGTDLVRPDLHAPDIAARFDIVSLDPRGTSGETDIDCIPAWDPFGDLDRTPDDAAERRALDARIRELAAGCRERHGAVLPHLGTAETVLDLEALRIALGEERVNLLGWSHGTAVALRYASAFPDRTGAVVLDGYSDPDLPAPERELEQIVAFERQLDELLVECALTAGCPVEKPAPGDAIDRLLDELDEAPMPLSDGGELTESDVYEAITGALVRGPVARQRLMRAIADADDGDGSALHGMADRFRHDFVTSGLDLGTFMAITCVDDAASWARLGREEVVALTVRISETAPRLGRWLWSPPAAEDLPPIGLCAMTPEVPPPDPGPFLGTGAGPILILAATGDPATPFAAAVRASSELADAGLLAIRADQHLVYPQAVATPDTSTSRCVLEAVQAHLASGGSSNPGAC